MGGPLNAALEALRAGNVAEAASQVRVAEGVPDRTAFENYYLARIKSVTAQRQNDFVASLQSFEVVLASPFLTEAERPIQLEAAVTAAWRGRAADRAEAFAREYFKVGGTNEGVRTVLVQALSHRGAHAEMLKELGVLIADDEKAGRKVLEGRWKLQAQGQFKLNDIDGYLGTLEKLIRDYPSQAYWRDLIARTEQHRQFADRLVLDTLRLMRQVGVLEDGEEYVNLAELANRAGQPIEALAAVEAGFKAGKLGQGAQAAAHNALRDRLSKAAAEDKARLATSRADAEKAKDGGQLIAMGQVFASLGDYETAASLMGQGMQKGVSRNLEEARLRYGAVLVQAGKREQAQEVLAKVRGDDGTAALARMWTLVNNSPR